MTDRFPRFDGAKILETLLRTQRDAIGAAALELQAARIASSVQQETAYGRACAASAAEAEAMFEHKLFAVLPGALFRDDKGKPRIPSGLGPICRECGCTEHDACDGGCAWADESLCTSCVARVDHGEMVG